MNMKRTFSCVLASLLLLPVLLLPAAANSEPVTYPGTNGSALTPDENCPITVTEEQLTFTVGSADRRSVLVDVSAVYQMENPTSQSQSVTMAFSLDLPDTTPYGTDRYAQYTDTISITADGEALPFEVQTTPLGGGTTRAALIYTVEFPAQDSREVAVSYTADSTASRQSAIRWQGELCWKQEVGYLLSPAQNWASFGTLDITVNTTEEYPYILESSHPLEADGDYRYTAHFDSLPDGELSFTLYPKEKITLWDRIYTAATDPYLSLLLLFFGLPLVILIAVIAAAVCLVRRHRKRQL